MTTTKTHSKPIKFISPRSFSSGQYPKFIRQHPVLKQNPKIQKIFPLIGLKNQFLSSKFLQYLSNKEQKRFFAAKNYQIVFSSDPWDIATMSMRGVRSCQRWDSSHSCHLIGSILDPCCAVIYLTDGTKTPKGSKMLVRSIVRFVLDRNTRKKKYVVVDEPYWEAEFSNQIDENLSSGDIDIQEIFVEALQKMLTMKGIMIKSVGGQDDYRANDNFCIPYSPTHQGFIGLNKHSFRDAPIPYWSIKPERLPKAVQKIGWGDGTEESREMDEDIE